MKRVFYQGELEGDILSVYMTHYAPETLDVEVLDNGYLVEFADDEPQPVNSPGKIYKKKLNIVTEEVTYEEQDIPLTPQEQEIASLKTENAELKRRADATDDVLLQILFGDIPAS